MYVKADIEENNINIIEEDKEKKHHNKPNGKFLQKALLLVLTLTILVTVIIRFQ